MMKITHALVALGSLLSCASGLTANPILESLEQQDMAPALLTDGELAQIRGAALQKIINMPSPSVTMGIREHLVTYKKFGSVTDYSSYRYIGSSYDAQASLALNYGGVKIRTAGDVWLADKYSSAYEWKRVNASPIERHLQALDANGRPLGYGFRDSLWNRPISRFFW